MKLNKVVALTGGIGSGKSYALSVLSDAGYPTLSSDEIVKELYETNAVKKKLKKLFPFAVSGKKELVLDKSVIASTVFKDQKLHQKLTKTITPLVLKQIKKRTKGMIGLVFVEVPLLFECNYQKHFDAVMVIMRDKNTRISSVMARNNMTEEQVLERINKQVDYDNLDLSECLVIENDGDLSFLKSKVLQIAYELDI